ncbi:MAG: apolipoprotein N-acyltransferase [Treponema sp.]|jgi:apolipoprotein N-acyltransferase|nr:apolipoprotein N-acyltransferase [Treponema sp.]
MNPGMGIKSFFINLAAIVLGIALFAAAFPNLLFENGIPLLAWVAYIPVFWVIRRSSPGACVFWGALYGYGAYSLFNYWLSVFHPLGGLIVNSIYMVYLALLFPVLRLALAVYPKRGYILQWLIWLAFEYLRTRGFLGYAYGIIGYSQWQMLPLIQIASFTGVWGVSALVVFPSAWIASALPVHITTGREVPPGSVVKESRGRSKTPPFETASLGLTANLRFALWDKLNLKAFFRREKVSALLWAAALAAALVYGFISLGMVKNAAEDPDTRIAKIALIQHNTDPWKGGIEQYRQNYRVLKRLSDEAIAAEAGLDLVVWSETAFVPRIYWHQTVRDDHESWVLVKELLDYLKTQDVPFVIGNDDARKEPAKNPNVQEDNRVDYNAVMLFEKGEITDLYRKLHLVPFTEHFPYQKQFPWVYDALINADTHFWEMGNEATVFNARGIKFSTPICFEDTFGDISRQFTQNGAELIVNLSIDAWSASLPAQMQHLSMAVFRAVENRRSMVRSTASGQSCAIDPSGRVLAMAPPFTEAALTVHVPIITMSSGYTKYGDFLAYFAIFAALILLIPGIFWFILKRIQKRR